MKTNVFTVMSLFLVVLLSISLVSAANGFSLSKVDDLPSTVDAGTTYSVKVNFANTNTTYSAVNVTMSGSDISGLVTNDSVTQGSNKDYSLTIDVPNSAFNSYSTTLTLNIYNGSTLVGTETTTFSATVSDQSFCQELGYNESTGDLEITEFDISNDGTGDDDKWNILDEIEIEVAVENTNNNDDIDDVQLEIQVRDSNGNDVTDDFDFDDEKIDLGDIKDDDEETATFVIKKVPADIDEDDYRIYVAAYSEDDDTNCSSSGNDFDNFGSSDFYAEIEVEKEYDSGIAVDEDTLLRQDVFCGQNGVQVSFDLYNIGSDKEESVLVELFNDDLGIDETLIIENFREGKRKEAGFVIDLPNNMDRDIYSLFITTYWDWDDDEDEDDVNAYDENSEDDLDETYAIRIEKIDECGASGSNSGSGNSQVIRAQLASENVAVGEEVLVRATVTNPTQATSDFTVSVQGHDSWAELESVQPSLVTLGAGESSDVTIRFTPTQGGTQGFTVLLSNGNTVYTQDVSLNVDSGNSGFFGGSSGDDSVMWWIAIALAILIIFLIIVIIVVAARR